MSEIHEKKKKKSYTTVAIHHQHGSPHSKIHGSDDEQRERMNPDHDDHEHSVEHHFKETCKAKFFMQQNRKP